MALLDRLAGSGGYDIDQRVDCHELVRAEVQWQPIVGPHDTKDSFHALVDVHKRAGLLAVTPYFDFVLVLAGSQLAADCGRRLLSTAIIRSQRPVDIVEPNDASCDMIILSKILAQLFHK